MSEVEPAISTSASARRSAGCAARPRHRRRERLGWRSRVSTPESLSSCPPRTGCRRSTATRTPRVRDGGATGSVTGLDGFALRRVVGLGHPLVELGPTSSNGQRRQDRLRFLPRSRRTGRGGGGHLGAHHIDLGPGRAHPQCPRLGHSATPPTSPPAGHPARLRHRQSTPAAVGTHHRPKPSTSNPPDFTYSASADAHLRVAGSIRTSRAWAMASPVGATVTSSTTAANASNPRNMTTTLSHTSSIGN